MEERFSPQYLDYIQSPEWQEKAKQRRSLDGNKCHICGSHDNLQVHHITYERLGREDIEHDLITLCKDCHEIVHENKNAILGGIIEGALIVRIDETDGRLEGFFCSHGLTKMAKCAADRWRSTLRVLYIPIPDGGALTVPFSSNFYCEKDAMKMCKYLGEDFFRMRIGAAEIYHAALEAGGYVDDIPSLDEQEG